MPGLHVTKRTISLAVLAGWCVWAMDVRDLELAVRIMFVLWLTDKWWKE
jgi:hypothetical protein